MKRKGLNLCKHLKSDVTCWICFNMLPSARRQLALIYSNSGKLTKTLVLTEITEFGRSLSLNWWLLFFVSTTNELNLLYYTMTVQLKKLQKNNISLQRRTVLPDKENYVEHRDCILVLRYKTVYCLS